MMTFTAFNPVQIEFGPSRISDLGSVVHPFGKKSLVITMKEILDLGILDPSFQSLEKAGIDYEIFHGLKGEPKSDDIERVTELAVRSGCDMLIGIGGGSCIDTAKAVAISATHPENIWEYVNLSNRPPKPINKANVLPIIAVPTTAGTGSEVTPYSVITNSKTIQKGTIKDPAIFPKTAVVDPELTIKMPLGLTASTGIDAFAHALESYFNVPNRSVWSDMTVEESLKWIVKSLPLVCKDGENIEGRAGMAWGSTLGGLAISQAGTTVVHALAQPLGARTGLPHGISVAIFLSAVLRKTFPEEQNRLSKISYIMGASPDLNEHDAALITADLIEDFIKSSGVSFKISECSAMAEKTLIEDLANDVLTYMSRPLRQHPKVFTKEELKEIITDSY
jgi:alcohol dehydrogenase